jgi:phosphatidate cytidylyltransferase
MNLKKLLSPDLGQKINQLAGRDLLAAILTAVISLTSLVLCLIYLPVVLVILLYLLTVIAYFELRKLFLNAGIQIPLIFLNLCSMLLFYFSYTSSIDIFILVYLICIVASLLYSAFDTGDSNKLFNACASVFSFTYVSFLIGFLFLILNEPFGKYKVILAFTLGIANDTGAWALGRLLGKHKIAPRISPKKSWEGFGGGLLLSLGWAFALTFLVFPENYVSDRVLFTLIAAVLGCILAVIGDLAESLLKRTLGSKDSGDFFPGHGGVLDRADSIVLVLPAMYLLYGLF